MMHNERTLLNVRNSYAPSANLSVGTAVNEGFLSDWTTLKNIAIEFREGEPHLSHEEQFPNLIRIASGHLVRRHRRRPFISSHIKEAIHSSRRILELTNNWDDEGSPGYQEQTWIRATKFVARAASDYRRHHHVWVIPPRILAGPEGSIDIHWKTQKRELLINIPADNEAGAGYFGTGGPKDNIKGKLDTSSNNEWVLAWLLR